MFHAHIAMKENFDTCQGVHIAVVAEQLNELVVGAGSQERAFAYTKTRDQLSPSCYAKKSFPYHRIVSIW